MTTFEAFPHSGFIAPFRRPPLVGTRPDPRYWRCGSPDEHALMLIGGIPVCHAAIHWRACTADGRRILVGGMGDVMTPVAEQRKGHATKLMRWAAGYLRGRGADASVLFCLDPLLAFYEGLGWHRFRGETVMRRPDGVGPPPGGVNTCILSFTAEPRLKLDIGGWPW